MSIVKNKVKSEDNARKDFIVGDCAPKSPVFLPAFLGAFLGAIFDTFIKPSLFHFYLIGGLVYLALPNPSIGKNTIGKNIKPAAKASLFPNTLESLMQ